MSATTDQLSSHPLDRYMPEDVRTILEQRFWQTVEENSTLETFSGDETVLSTTDTHTALFSDHGIVHARDVAAGTLELAGVLEGGLLPTRPADRREFVAALAVLIAYIHDVGMNDPTREGRRVHPIYAAQIPFSGAMDDVLARLWETGGPPSPTLNAWAPLRRFASRATSFCASSLRWRSATASRWCPRRCTATSCACGRHCCERSSSSSKSTGVPVPA